MKNGVTKHERQQIALIQLVAQLKSNIKPRKSGTYFKNYPEEQIIRNDMGKPVCLKLTEKDITRIKKQIEILKSKTL